MTTETWKRCGRQADLVGATLAAAALSLTLAACDISVPNAVPSPGATAARLAAEPVATDRAEPARAQAACAGTTEPDHAGTGRGLQADRGGEVPPTAANPVSTALADIEQLSFGATPAPGALFEPWGAVSGGDLMHGAIGWHEGVLYAAWGSGLRVYEAPGTAPPRPVGGALLPIQADEAALRWPYLFVLDRAPQEWETRGQGHVSGRLVVVDVRRPEQPVDAFGNLRVGNAVAVAGDHLLVADGPSGVVILDAADPAALRRVGAMPADDARAVAVSGRTAFVADADAGLRVFDLANARQPTLLATLPNPIPDWPLDRRTLTPTPGESQGFGNPIVGVTVDPERHDRAYAIYYNGWRIVDVSDRTAPRFLGGRDNTGQGGPSVLARGDTAYELHGLCMVTVVDIRDPLDIRERGSECPKGGGVAALGEGTLYALNGYLGELDAIDVRDPDHLRPVWHQWVPALGLGGFVLGDRTLVVDGSGINSGLQAFDLGLRGLPESEVGLHMQSGGGGTWPAGTYYVATQDYNTHRVDLWRLDGGGSPPVVTRVWSFEPGPDEITRLSATNRVAFTAQSGHLGVWSLTEYKSQPAEDFSAPISDVLAIDDSALVSTNDGLLHGVLRTHDESTPRRLTSCRAGAQLRFLGQLGGTDAVFARTPGEQPELRRYTWPTLRETGRWPLPAGTLDAALDGDRLYVLAAPDNLAALSVAATGAPEPLGVVRLPWPSSHLATGGGYAVLGGNGEARVLRWAR